MLVLRILESKSPIIYGFQPETSPSRRTSHASKSLPLIAVALSFEDPWTLLLARLRNGTYVMMSTSYEELMIAQVRSSSHVVDDPCLYLRCNMEYSLPFQDVYYLREQ